jgi:hypothetical protein
LSVVGLLCNAYDRHVRWIEYGRMMQDLQLKIPTQQSEFDLPQPGTIRINGTAPSIACNVVELVPMSLRRVDRRAARCPISGRRVVISQSFI